MALWLLGPVMALVAGFFYFTYLIACAIGRAIYDGVRDWFRFSDIRKKEREEKRKAKAAAKLAKLSGKTPRETP